MAKELYDLLLPTERRARMIEKLIETRKKLRSNGADNTAKAIYNNMMSIEKIL